MCISIRKFCIKNILNYRHPKSFTGKRGQIKGKTNGGAFREEKEELVAMGRNNAEHEKIVNVTKKNSKK